MDVTGHGLLSAMLSVPREHFVPEDKKLLAYIDEELSYAPTGPAYRYLMPAGPLAKLVQLCELTGDEFVLVIGAGSGYSCAVLSMLSSSVVAVEEDAGLLETCENNLSELGYDNVAVVSGPLEAGWPTQAPYDVILIDGAVDFVPDAILSQLQVGGRLVAVEGTGNSAVSRLYVNDDGVVSGRDVANCAVQPLPGFKKKEEFVF